MLQERQDWYRVRQNPTFNRLIRLESPKKEIPQVLFRLRPYSKALISDDSLPLRRIGINGELWMNPSENSQVHLRARLENHGELYSQFHGRIWKEKVTGWVDNAAFYFARDGFFGSVGRSSLVWGPELHDALLLSANSPPFDRLWLGYEHSSFRLDFMVARLDNFQRGDSALVRYLSAHRLSFRKKGLFEFGLSEVALYGGYNRPLEWHYLNPFLPYYWEQWNQSTDDNIFFGADFTIYWPNNSRIFGELLIDDFQVDFKSEPHQIGFKLGLDMLEPAGLKKLYTKLSYTRVNRTVYSQNRLQNLYLHYGESIGYFGGNDQDRLLLFCRYHFCTSFDGEIEWQYQRRGEGRIEQIPGGTLPYGVKFPSGIVERAAILGIGLKFFSKSMLEGHLKLGYTHYENYHHQCGRDGDQLDLNLLVSYYLQGLIR